MMNFETFALVWPFVAIGLVVAFAFFTMWLTDYWDRRDARKRAAE